MKVIKILVLLFSFIFLISCGVKIQGIDLGRVVNIGSKAISSNKVTLEQEQEMGAQMAAVILGTSKLHPDAALQSYVNRVGSWVASQSERPNLNWTFAVIETKDINAFATPGGYILITSALLENLNSEAELAGVLAHEITHVVQQHHLNAINKTKTASLFGDVALLANDVYQSGRSRSSNSYMNQKIAENLLSSTQEIYSKGLSQDDEFDADEKALVLMTRAGYDPFAFVSVLQTLDSIQPDDSHMALLFSTHPKPSERINNIEGTLNYLEPKLSGTKNNEERYLNNTMGPVVD
jgi:predicted Zn-dependent protease